MVNIDDIRKITAEAQKASRLLDLNRFNNVLVPQIDKLIRSSAFLGRNEMSLLINEADYYFIDLKNVKRFLENTYRNEGFSCDVRMFESGDKMDVTIKW